MEYVKLSTIIVKAEADILLFGSGTEAGPGATNVGSPSVQYNSKSIWDEESDNTLFNIREERYEDKVHE